MEGLSGINLELTSRCNKGDGTPGSGCFMCGRRKMERDTPELCNWGDMPFGMVEDISYQVPSCIMVQLHNNGEPLMYDRLGDAIRLFRERGCYTGLDTNGKLLMEKADELIGNIDTLTISVIQDDPEGDEQYENILLFIDKKGDISCAKMARGR